MTGTGTERPPRSVLVLTVMAVVALASMTNSVKTTMFQTTGKPEKKYSSVFMPISA